MPPNVFHSSQPQALRDLIPSDLTTTVSIPVMATAALLLLQLLLTWHPSHFLIQMRTSRPCSFKKPSLPPDTHTHTPCSPVPQCFHLKPALPGLEAPNCWAISPICVSASAGFQTFSCEKHSLLYAGQLWLQLRKGGWIQTPFTAMTTS